MKTPEDIFYEAQQAGYKAANEFNATLPPESQRGFDCGFAWVTVHPAKGPFVKYCKENKLGSKAYKGGWEFWYSLFSTNTQSVGVHEKAATAFCNVLRAHGLTAYVGSRLD